LSLGAYRISDDGNLLAYSTDTTGYRQYTLVIRISGPELSFPRRSSASTPVMWATDNKTIFYVTEDAVTKRSDSFYRHVLARRQEISSSTSPTSLRHRRVPNARQGLHRRRVAEANTSEFAIFPPEAGRSVARRRPRAVDHKYFLDHRGDLFYIRTNDHAKNYRLVTAPDSAPEMKNWKEVIRRAPT